jgi:hypothetical protein
MNNKYLRKGKVYFIFSFIDTHMDIPEIMSLIYLGKNLGEKNINDNWFFQDAQSYVKIGALYGKKAKKPHKIIIMDTDSIKLIKNLSDLQKSLKRYKNGRYGKPRKRDLIF